MTRDFPLARRSFLKAGAAALAAPLLPAGLSLPAMAAEPRRFTLKASPANLRLAPEPFPETPLWVFNGQTPGPEIRIRHGESVHIRVENEIDDETSVHWHGLRIPHAMDGVAHLTQPPIPKGGSFDYIFTPPDAGTFWYHPHVHSLLQANKGLYGALIVEEAKPYPVDRDLTWVLGDWRLQEDAKLRDNFFATRDYMRAGRLGNTVTLNGQVAGEQKFRANERVRIRLINACDSRVFGLRFLEHKPTIIAVDGQPVDQPFVPQGGAIVLGPAQRADIILDMTGKPGERFEIIDAYYAQAPYVLTDIVYEDSTPVRDKPKTEVPPLAPNKIPVPVIKDAQVETIVLEGGDITQLKHLKVEGQEHGPAELMARGQFWAINGRALVHNHSHEPLFKVPLGRTCILRFQNRSAWPHPMHLHGHSFTVLEHDGDRAALGHRRDTVLLGPGETSMVAFVADNPGDWMLHCHIFGHSDAGMQGIVRVG